MTTIAAAWAMAGVPLESPADAPTIRIRRADTGALVVTDAAMTEVGDGAFAFTFAPDDALDYTIRADGDPLGTGQVPAGERYRYGSVSGATEAAESLADAAVSDVLAAIAALPDADAVAIADAVWTEPIADHEATPGSPAEAIASLRNRVRIDFTAGPPRELVVYAQDGVTELYRAPLTTTNGTDVLAFFGVQHERGAPT